MKQSIKLLTIACCIVIFTQMSLGQAIKVDSDGDVGIGGDPCSQDLYDLKVHGSVSMHGGDLHVASDGEVGVNGHPGGHEFNVLGTIDISNDLLVHDDIKLVTDIYRYTSYGHMDFGTDQTHTVK